MKKILWIVVLIVVLGGGYVLYTNSSSSAGSSPAGGVGEFTSAPAGATAFSGSIADLVAGKAEMRCFLTQDKAQANLFAGGGKVRLDVTIKTPQVTLDKHTLFDGQELYVWDSTAAEGLKTKLTFAELKKKDPSFESKTAGYMCAPATVAGDTFTPPSNITFKSY